MSSIFYIKHEGPPIKNFRSDLTPLPCPCGRIINFEKNKVFQVKKGGHPKSKTLDKILTPTCGRLLWTAFQKRKNYLRLKRSTTQIKFCMFINATILLHASKLQ